VIAKGNDSKAVLKLVKKGVLQIERGPFCKTATIGNMRDCQHKQYNQDQQNRGVRTGRLEAETLPCRDFHAISGSLHFILTEL
jgi:hypothetical protein